MKSDRIRVGIIGVGAISGRHYEGFVETGAKVVALADPSEAALASRALEWDVDRTYTDFHAMIADGDLDAVTIAAPNAVHHPATIAAARAGLHVMCEKPISMNLELAQEMIDVCNENGVLLQISHQLRSSGAASYTKGLLTSGALGDVTFVRLRQAHDWSGAESVRESFGKMANAGGGTLLDNGTHMFDLANFFAGRVHEVYARTATRKFQVEVEDTAVVSLQFESGAIGAVESAWTATGWEEAFWVWGTRGAVEYTNRYGRPRLRYQFRDSPGTTWGDTDVATVEFAGEPNHTRHIRSFLEAIRGERDVVCTGVDGLEAIRLVLASYRSAATNRPVIVDHAPIPTR